jgi:hypothetical protein
LASGGVALKTHRTHLQAVDNLRKAEQCLYRCISTRKKRKKKEKSVKTMLID